MNGYGLGFFDDDDLSVRVQEAGYQLLVGQDVFIHHFGSRTFKSLEVDCQKQLQENLELFKAKWGPEHSAGYRMQAQTVLADDPTIVTAPLESNPLTPNPLPRRGEGVRSECARRRVSLCFIARNEEDSLPACLESAQGLADEVVVVDTGSTDRTKEIAASFGASVFDFPWIDNFAAARNETLRHATGDWIFWMDADDRLDAANRDKLRALFAGLKDENLTYSMTCQAGRQLYPDDTELLFQEGLVRRELGAPEESEECFLHLLQGKNGDYFASVDAGLRGYKTRHNLAVLYGEQGRLAEAEAQWRAAVAEQSRFAPAWLGLAALYLAQGRFEDMGQAAAQQIFA